MELDALDRLAAEAFPGSLVRKDLALKFQRQYPVPTYVGEFLLGRYCASTDPVEIEDGLKIVERQLKERTVRAGEHELFKSHAREDGSVKLIDIITARLDAASDSYMVSLPSLQLKDVRIADALVRENERMLTGGFYAEIELQYFPDMEKGGRPFSVASLRPIQESKRDILSWVARGRAQLTTQQWRDLLIRSIGFEPDRFSPRTLDLLILRMVPFVERNYNMAELGPRGTGKSHLFQQVSPYSHLVSGGKASVARMFVDNRTGQRGLVAQYDVVCFDEVSGIDFDSKDGVNIMKGYMESGEFSRGRESIRATGGIVMVGNFDIDVAQQLAVGHLFGPFPKEMRDDTAFMDRIHAYLPGWDIPKIQPTLFTNHFGLVSDYMAEMWSRLRDELRLPALQGRLTLGPALSGRDRGAVNRTISGLLKLLHPDAEAEDPDEDVEWAAHLALEMRRRVKEQQKRIGRDEFGKTEFTFSLTGVGEDIGVTVPEAKIAITSDAGTRAADPSTGGTDPTGLPADQQSQDSDEFPTHDVRHAGLTSQPPPVIEPPPPSPSSIVTELIASGEGPKIEFKAAFRWDDRQERENPELQRATTKTIAAFLNSDGGHLLIGVQDTGTICGLDQEFAAIARQGRDTRDLFLQHLAGTITKHLGPDVIPLVTSRLVDMDGKLVCLVTVAPSDSPVPLRDNKGNEEFFIRVETTTRALTASEAISYARRHWKT